MSMPSSSASVATTASSSPSARRRSISRRCAGRVAGAVGRDPLGQVAAARVLEAQPGEALDQLHAAARLQEADRPHVPLHQLGQQRGRLGQRRARRMPLSSSTSGGFHIAISRSARGAPSRSTSVKSRPVSSSASSTRVGDRRAREHEARLGAVGARQPPQAPQHVGHVRAEHAAVDVRLVDHHPGEVGAARRPSSVVRQHAHVQHVRVREDQVRAVADRARAPRAACRRRRSRGAGSGRRARTACAPGPGPAPWSGRGRARGRAGRARACRAPAG